MNRTILVLLFCALVFRPASAQLAPTLSLQDALREADQHNSGVLAARSEVEGARARLEQAALNPLQVQGGINSAPDSPEGAGVLRTSTIGIEQQFGSFGALDASRRIASAAVQSAQARLAGIRRDISQRVVAAYFTVAQAGTSLELAKNGLAIAQRLRDSAELRRRVGAVGSFEVLRADVEVERARSEVVRAEGSGRSARFALNALLGRAIETPTIVAPLESTLLVNTTMFSGQAPAADPQVAELRAAILGADARERLARSGRMPTVTLSAGVQSTHSRFLGQTTTGPSLGATLSIPLVDYGSIRGAVREAQTARSAAQQQLAGRELQFQAELAQAASDMEAAQSRLQFARKSVKQAEEGLRIAQIGYRRGALSALDVLSARNSALAAKADFYQALSDLASAIARSHILRGDF